MEAQREQKNAKKVITVIDTLFACFFFHAFLGTAFMRVAFLTAKDSDLILVVSILVIKKVAKKTLTLT